MAESKCQWGSTINYLAPELSTSPLNWIAKNCIYYKWYINYSYWDSIKHREDKPGQLMSEPQLVQQLLIFQNTFHQPTPLLWVPVKQIESFPVLNISAFGLIEAAGASLWWQSWHLRKCHRCRILWWRWAEPLACVDLLRWWQISSLERAGTFAHHTFQEFTEDRWNMWNEIYIIVLLID